MIETVAPLRFRGNEVVLFHVLDPEEIRPKLKHPVMLEDLETGETMEVTPDYAAHEYATRWTRTWRTSKAAPKARAWIISWWTPAGRWMRRCASIWRCGRGGCKWVFFPLVFGRRRRRGAADLAAPAEAPQNRSPAVSLADVFRASRAKLGDASPPGSHPAVHPANADAGAAGAAVRQPVHQRRHAQSRGQEDGGGRGGQFLQHARRCSGSGESRLDKAKHEALECSVGNSRRPRPRKWSRWAARCRR